LDAGSKTWFRLEVLLFGKVSIPVFLDGLGKLVYSENCLNVDNEFTHSLNLGYLSNGIYILHLENKETGYAKRFIINK
jgi:hypothetical protein